MKIKKTRIFFMSFGFVVSELLPLSLFYIVSLWKLVNKIARELLEPGSCYLDHTLCLTCR